MANEWSTAGKKAKSSLKASAAVPVRKGANLEERVKDLSWMLFHCKVDPCPAMKPHDAHDCLLAHRTVPGAWRRDPRKFHYFALPCPYKDKSENKMLCDLGERCCFTHSNAERGLHPGAYNTTYCGLLKAGKRCLRGWCSFYHEECERRVPTRDYNPTLEEFEASEAQRPASDLQRADREARQRCLELARKHACVAGEAAAPAPVSPAADPAALFAAPRPPATTQPAPFVAAAQPPPRPVFRPPAAMVAAGQPPGPTRVVPRFGSGAHPARPPAYVRARSAAPLATSPAPQSEPAVPAAAPPTIPPLPQATAQRASDNAAPIAAAAPHASPPGDAGDDGLCDLLALLLPEEALPEEAPPPSAALRTVDRAAPAAAVPTAISRLAAPSAQAVYVRGIDGVTTALGCDLSDSVGALVQRYIQQCGTDAHATMLRLLYGGKLLDPGVSLAQAGVAPGETLRLLAVYK